MEVSPMRSIRFQPNFLPAKAVHLSLLIILAAFYASDSVADSGGEISKQVRGLSESLCPDESVRKIEEYRSREEEFIAFNRKYPLVRYMDALLRKLNLIRDDYQHFRGNLESDLGRESLAEEKYNLARPMLENKVLKPFLNEVNFDRRRLGKKPLEYFIRSHFGKNVATISFVLTDTPGSPFSDHSADTENQTFSIDLNKAEGGKLSKEYEELKRDYQRRLADLEKSETAVKAIPSDHPCYMYGKLHIPFISAPHPGVVTEAQKTSEKYPPVPSSNPPDNTDTTKPGSAGSI